MIRQTCQRCGYIFPDFSEGGLATAETREEAMVWVQIGEWERKYHLCEPCAAMVQREVNWLATGGYPAASRPDGRDPGYKVLPKCPSCGKPFQVCSCEGCDA